MSESVKHALWVDPPLTPVGFPLCALSGRRGKEFWQRSANPVLMVVIVAQPGGVGAFSGFIVVTDLKSKALDRPA